MNLGKKPRHRGDALASGTFARPCAIFQRLGQIADRAHPTRGDDAGVGVTSRGIMLLSCTVVLANFVACGGAGGENPTSAVDSAAQLDAWDTLGRPSTTDTQVDMETAPDGGCKLGHGCANNFECSKSCTESPACKWKGQCCAKSLASVECVARSEDDCRKSFDCETGGVCGLRGETCAALTDADCEQSWACSGGGRCSARNGICIATSDEVCKGISSCKLDGYCSALNGECQPTSDADCAASTNCKKLGKCVMWKNADGSTLCACAMDPKKYCAASEP